jgi:TPR repeat protein
VESIREAAELGHVEAQAALGMLLLHGVGQQQAVPPSSAASIAAAAPGKKGMVANDERAALAWIRRAALSENRDAQWMLGKALFEAEDRRATALGQPGRFGEAVAFFRKAAAQVRVSSRVGWKKCSLRLRVWR